MPPTNPRPVASFFEEWLPARFKELANQDPTVGRTDCSLLVVAGDDKYWLSLADGGLRVSRVEQQHAPTFRLHGDEASFVHLLEGAVHAGADSTVTNPKALKLLSLDAETVKLVASIPSCVSLRIVAADASHEIVFGPGVQPETNIGCTAECQSDDWVQLRQGQTDPIELFMSGRLKLEGDLQVAMALSSILL